MIISEKVDREIEINETIATIANQLESLIQKYIDIIADRDKELNDLYDAMEKKEDHIRNLEGTVNDLKDRIYRMEESAGVYPAWTRR
ncbi:MAG: hypothetical protein GX352_03150 [Clostridiales bacterium]|nr:hypothetical protein [Clostridiales bacterium]